MKVNKVDKEKAITLRKKGLTLREIGDLFDVSPAAIYKHVKGVGELAEFRDTKENVFEFHQARILNQLTGEDIKKMSGTQKVVAAAVLEDKIRLIRGQSTANVAILVGAIEDLQRKMQEEKDKT